MVVCPMCEHAQAGGPECEVCGHRLEGVPDAGPPIPFLEGLESTLLASVPELPTEPVPGLEPTGVAPVAPPPEPLLAELEFTGAAPVDPPIAELPDLERASEEAVPEERTPYPAVVVCRYCRTVAAPGARLCDRCGMRLPVTEPATAAPAPDAQPLLCSCGTPIRGARCPSCGGRTPAPT